MLTKKREIFSKVDLKNHLDKLSKEETSRIVGGNSNSEIYIAPPPPGTVRSGIGVKF